MRFTVLRELNGRPFFDAAYLRRSCVPIYRLLEHFASQRCGSCLREITGDIVHLVLCDWRAPLAGTGWGCATCGLDADGAIAVVCDECGRTHGAQPAREWIQEVALGDPRAGHRQVVHGDLVPFVHDGAAHAAASEATGCRRTGGLD